MPEANQSDNTEGRKGDRCFRCGRFVRIDEVWSGEIIYDRIPLYASADKVTRALWVGHSYPCQYRNLRYERGAA